MTINNTKSGIMFLGAQKKLSQAEKEMKQFQGIPITNQYKYLGINNIWKNLSSPSPNTLLQDKIKALKEDVLHTQKTQLPQQNISDSMISFSVSIASIWRICTTWSLSRQKPKNLNSSTQ